MYQFSISFQQTHTSRRTYSHTNKRQEGNADPTL